MGDMRQYKLIKHNIPFSSSRVLEIGSKHYGEQHCIRSLFPNSIYVGVDFVTGENVDVVCDLCATQLPFREQFFDCIICCSVLEHTRQPWIMAAHIESLLRDGGLLYISVPWIFPYHGYPIDCFRFSPDGVRALFPNVRWTKVGGHSGPTGPFFEWDGGTPNRHLRVKAGDGEFMFRKCMIDMIGTKVQLTA